MQKTVAISGISALTAVVFSALPSSAFGYHLGPFHFHLPFVGHHYHRHHTYTRAAPNEDRTKPNEVFGGGGNTEALESCTGLALGVTFAYRSDSTSRPSDPRSRSSPRKSPGSLIASE